MERKKRIEKILFNNFKLSIIEVVDISSKHSGHNEFSGNDETHFSIKLNYKEKDKLKIIDIHRKINYLLRDEFLSGLHALEIKLNNI